jgi:hypothetical protein
MQQKIADQVIAQLFPAKPPSIHDAKIGVLSDVASPPCVDLIDTRRTGTLLRPTVQIAYGGFFSFSNNF